MFRRPKKELRIIFGILRASEFPEKERRIYVEATFNRKSSEDIASEVGLSEEIVKVLFEEAHRKITAVFSQTPPTKSVA